MVDAIKSAGTGNGQTGTGQKAAEAPKPADPARLLECVRKGDLGNVMEAVRLGGDFKSPDKNWHWTPLMFAAREKHNGIATFLIDEGADIYAVDDHNSSVMAKAATAGNNEMVRYIGRKMVSLDNTGPLYLADDNGFTPLMNAAMNGKTDTAIVLLELGAVKEINQINHDGDTAAMLAVAWGHVETFGMLKGWGADITIKNRVGLDAAGVAEANRYDPSLFGLQRH